MKFKSIITTGLAVISFGFLSCNEAPKGDNVTISEKQDALEAKGASFTADTTSSRIRFTGHGVGKNHPGVFKLSSGTVYVADNKISGGNFVINIKSLDLEQKGGMFDSKLYPHLLINDLKKKKKFATSKFEITDVQPYTANSADTSIVAGANYTISGNFTLKDVTKNISFPAKVDLDGNTLKAKGNFNIDRTEWNMNYNSDKSLGDKFISETVNIQLDLEARKQG